MPDLITRTRLWRPLFRFTPTISVRKMSAQPKVIGKLYMYASHSRWHRLQAIAAAANVAFEPVQNFSVMKAMNDPEFLSKFPGGTVPAFESMDGKVCLTECSAIADYIACTNPESELIPTDAGEAAQVRNWLLICEAEIIAPLTVVNRAHLNFFPSYDSGMVQGIMDTIHRRMNNINNWVATRSYLVGDRLSLADLTLASTLGHGYAKFFDKEWRNKYPDAFAYFQRIISEPRVKDAFGEPTLVDKTPDYKHKQ